LGVAWLCPSGFPGQASREPAHSAGTQCPHARFGWCAGVVRAVFVLALGSHCGSDNRCASGNMIVVITARFVLVTECAKCYASDDTGGYGAGCEHCQHCRDPGPRGD
jgi:hypothetical protein